MSTRIGAPLRMHSIIVAVAATLVASVATCPPSGSLRAAIKSVSRGSPHLSKFSSDASCGSRGCFGAEPKPFSRQKGSAQGSRRRAVLSHFLLAASAAMLPPARPAFADRGSLGADGLFPDCDSNTCVSSQDDRPQVWDPPWIFEDSLEESVKSLKRVITDRLGGTIEQSDDRYVRARFESRGLLNSVVVDDAEFFFAPNDTLVQFRASRQGEGGSDFGENRKRLERARLALGWEQVPVLRNRRRALVVVESAEAAPSASRQANSIRHIDAGATLAQRFSAHSAHDYSFPLMLPAFACMHSPPQGRRPFDTFGPSRNERDELGFTPGEMVPAEIPRREIYGDLDPYAARWQAPSLGMRQRRAAELGKELRQFWEQESDDRVRSK